jgi:DNA-binding transcriptional LysR family regulator
MPRENISDLLAFLAVARERSFTRAAALVGAPSYFARRKPPETPHELTAHSCINIRFPTHGGLYAWEFERDERELKVRVDGQLVFNNIALRLNAVPAGLGLAYLPEGQVQPLIAEGRLIRVLADWCLPFAGYHLYYPSSRQASPAFALLVDALRHRG